MTRLLRSPFPVAPKAPALLQHDLFGGPPMALDAADDTAASTPAMRRWCEIGMAESQVEPAFTDQGRAAAGSRRAGMPRTGSPRTGSIEEGGAATTAAGSAADTNAERHGSRPGQLSRPGHSNGGRNLQSPMDRHLAILDRTLRTRAPRVAAFLSTPEASSCGHAPGHRAAPGISAKDRSSRSGARTRPIIIRRRRVQTRQTALATADVRNAGAGMIEATGRISPETLPMSSPTQAQPEWSCATTWLRAAEASGEDSMHQVTAAASYMFVAAMLAFTFVI
ncbi:hypothetical protein N9Z54_07915 [Planctomycetota bacterium]|nr:hypothetical protein [Planctomycetota bacterium]